MKDRLPLRYCKRVLALIWFVGAGALMALLAVQSLSGYYGSNSVHSQIWAWYLGAVSPTLGLITAVLAAEALAQSASAQTVDAFFYRIAAGVSAMYLTALWSVVLMPLMRNDLEEGLPQLIVEAGSWLTMLQGLVTASLGVFYARRSMVQRAETGSVASQIKKRPRSKDTPAEDRTRP